MHMPYITETLYFAASPFYVSGTGTDVQTHFKSTRSVMALPAATPCPAYSAEQAPGALPSRASLRPQLLIGLFHIQPCKNQRNQKIEDHRQPQIHDMEHIDTGSRLFRGSSHISAVWQKPSRLSGSDASPKLCPN